MQVAEDRPLKKKAAPRTQLAALPFRLDAEGRPEILLITSRATRRWIIPKGWPMRGRKDHRAAEREAFEEAGARGRIGKTAIGRYRYDKRLDDGSALACAVTVYPLRVEEERKRWPERKQRQRCWYAAEEAASLVQECDLKELLRTFRGPADPTTR